MAALWSKVCTARSAIHQQCNAVVRGGYAAVGYNNTPGGSPLDSNEVVVRFDSLGNAETVQESIQLMLQYWRLRIAHQLRMLYRWEM